MAKKPQRINSEEFNNYIEFAAEFPELGNKYLLMASAKMNFIQYYCLDVYLVLLFLFVLFIKVLYFNLKILKDALLNLLMKLRKKID